VTSTVIGDLYDVTAYVLNQQILKPQLFSPYAGLLGNSRRVAGPYLQANIPCSHREHRLRHPGRMGSMHTLRRFCFAMPHSSLRHPPRIPSSIRRTTAWRRRGSLCLGQPQNIQQWKVHHCAECSQGTSVRHWCRALHPDHDSSQGTCKLEILRYQDRMGS
jgi:hypothetical protein